MARHRVDPEAENKIYLEMRREGLSTREIGKRLGVSHKTVLRGIESARLLEGEARRQGEYEKDLPHVEPTFGQGNKPFRLMTCADVHPGGPMPDGSKLMCPICHSCPAVDWRATFRNVRPLPRDPKVLSPAEVEAKREAKRTRKQRRALLRRFASVA